MRNQPARVLAEPDRMLIASDLAQAASDSSPRSLDLTGRPQSSGPVAQDLVDLVLRCHWNTQP